MVETAGQNRYRLGVLDGDGIGPEIVRSAVAVAEAALHSQGQAGAIEWLALPMGKAAIEDYGSPVPTQTLQGLTRVHGWIMGPHDSASYPEPYRSQLNPSGLLRKRFDLFANIRPARSWPLTRSPTRDLDIVIVRENIEGFYADRNTFAGTGEWMPSPDVAIANAVFTRTGVERIIHTAFAIAEQRNNCLTVVHKANVMPLTSGLYIRVAESLADRYPNVRIRGAHIDAFIAELVADPQPFDVVVTENMFGDILSALAGALSGSVGTTPSLNLASNVAMAQAAHGAAPELSGKGIANPTGLILSTGMLLGWLGTRYGDESLTRVSCRIENVVRGAIAHGISTPDLCGRATTESFTAALLGSLSRSGVLSHDW